MRLRNIPRAGNVLNESIYVIKNEESRRGNWAETVFHNTFPIHIEIGMGKGQFLLSLARRHPSINYIGIERYSSVLLRAVEKLPASPCIPGGDCQNLRFVCMDAAEIDTVFAPREISRIYLNFSDPWPKARHARRRLTSPEYFARYERILQPDGQVEFKTDNRSLFEYSAEVIDSSSAWQISALTFDLHRDGIMNEGNIMTEYEEKFSSMNNPICKLIAKRKSESVSCI